MVHLVARMEIKPGCMEKYLSILLANVPVVRAEKGCIRYEVCRDLEIKDGNDSFVTIVEAWESESALRTHQKAPHMLAYRENVRDLRANTVVHVLYPVEETK